jgi:hypothetical protein
MTGTIAYGPKLHGSSNPLKSTPGTDFRSPEPACFGIIAVGGRGGECRPSQLGNSCLSRRLSLTVVWPT